MEINDSGRLKHQRLHKIVASEYESSLAKAQDIKPPRQEPNISPSINEDNIIKGEIIDLRLHDVKIRLEPSGQVITAKVSAKLPLSIGQLANFIVSDKTGDQITLKLISSDTTPINDLVYKALYSAGLATSDKNLNLVQELLKYNMPVDKKTLMSLIKLTSTYPDTDITTLTLMYKNNLPINTSSVAQFESYQQGTHQILNELNSLADIIPNTIFDIQKSDDNTIDLTNAYKSEEVVISSNDKCHSPHLVSADTDNLLSLHKEILNIIRDGENRQIEYITNRELKHIFTENELIQLQDALNLTYLPDSMTLTELYHHVSNLYNKGNDFISIINNIKLTAHVFEAFIGMSYYMAKSDKEILFDLLNTNSYEDFIYDSLHNRWTLSPKDLVTSNKVTEYFRRLENDLESLQELSTNSKSSDISSVKSSLNKLQENLQFMRDLNNLFLYVQLPIRLLGQDAHGELYVFSKKKQALDLTEQISLLLHLDMANLGPLDIHMTMKDRYVQAVFYLEKESEHIIKEHINQLINLLSLKGYTLQAKTEVSRGKPDFITDILEQDVKEHMVYRHSFDIRA